MAKLSHQIAIGYYRAKLKLISAVSTRKAAKLAIELFMTPQFKERVHLPKIFTLAEKLSFEHYNETVTGYRWNKGGHKKVLIVHGFNSSVSKYDRYIYPLTQKGYEVLAFDAPAHGKSTGKTINAVIFKDMIISIQEKYGPVKSFMGHSFGGLAICLALEEIPYDKNYRVALVAPATESSTATDLLFSMLRLNQEVRKEFEDIVYQYAKKPMSWYSISRAIDNIKATVLWCHDEDDPITLWSDAKKVMDHHHDNIEFIITKGLGHRRIYRNSNVAKAIIDFL